jgi:hypothetical protein
MVRVVREGEREGEIEERGETEKKSIQRSHPLETVFYL